MSWKFLIIFCVLYLFFLFLVSSAPKVDKLAQKTWCSANILRPNIEILGYYVIKNSFIWAFLFLEFFGLKYLFFATQNWRSPLGSRRSPTLQESHWILIGYKIMQPTSTTQPIKTFTVWCDVGRIYLLKFCGDFFSNFVS